VGYGFIMHKFGRMALWNIAKESPVKDALVNYVVLNEIKKSLIGIKLIFDFEYPFHDHNQNTKVYIYAFRFMWFGYIPFALLLAYFAYPFS
jgi:hypothetical protein